MTSCPAEDRTHGPIERLSDRAAELLRWLGVPAFADHPAAWRYGRVVPLIWMIAFQLGVLSAFSTVTAASLISTAPVVAVLAFVMLPISASAIRRNCSWHRWLLPPLAVGPVAAFSWIRDSVLPLTGSDSHWFWPHYWCDAAVTLAALYAAMIVLLPQSQASSGRRWSAHWALLIFVAAANVASAVCFPIIWTMGNVGRATSLPALILISAVLAAVLLLPRNYSDDIQRSRSYAVAIPTAVLMLTFGLLNARLVYVVDRTTLLITVSTTCGALVLLALFSGTSTADQIVEHTGIRNLCERIPEPRPLHWIGFFLFAYPTVALTLLNQHIVAFGYDFDELGTFVALLMFNAGYLGFVLILVGFGLDQILAWSMAEFYHKTADTLRHIAASVPLLLIAVSFFALTAETWQIAHTLPRPTLLLLCGVQLALAIALAIGWSVPRVRRLAMFNSWEEVAEQITLPRRRSSEPRQNDRSDVVDELKRTILERTSVPQVQMRMNVAAWMNAMLVVLMYQFFVFAAIIVTLFMMFFALSRMAVSPQVAAEWIFGDGQAGRAVELVNRDALDSPWLRVPLFLTLFSSLYFATHSLASKDTRIEYFRGVDSAIRIRFAIRLGYRLAQWEEGRREAAPTEETPAIAEPGAA